MNINWDIFGKTQNMATDAKYLMFDEKFDETQTKIDEIFEFSENSPVGHRMQGWLHFVLGDKDLAIKSFDKSIELMPIYAYSYLQLAWVYAKDKNKEMTMKNLVLCKKHGSEHFMNNYRGDMVDQDEFSFLKDDPDFNDLVSLYPKDPIIKELYEHFTDDKLNLVIKKGQALLDTHEDPMAIAEMMMYTVKAIMSDLSEHGEQNLHMYDFDSIDDYKALKKELKNKISELEDDDLESDTFSTFKTLLY